MVRCFRISRADCKIAVSEPVGIGGSVGDVRSLGKEHSPWW